MSVTYCPFPKGRVQPPFEGNSMWSLTFFQPLPKVHDNGWGLEPTSTGQPLPSSSAPCSTQCRTVLTMRLRLTRSTLPSLVNKTRRYFQSVTRASKSIPTLRKGIHCFAAENRGLRSTPTTTSSHLAANWTSLSDRADRTTSSATSRTSHQQKVRLRPRQGATLKTSLTIWGKQLEATVISTRLSGPCRGIEVTLWFSGAKLQQIRAQEKPWACPAEHPLQEGWSYPNATQHTVRPTTLGNC